MYSMYFQTNPYSLNDHFQLQALLDRRERLQEQRRIRNAMHQIQFMNELYRRQELEEQAIAAYYEKKRQEKLYLAQQEFQRQQYYAALQQQQQQRQLQDQYRRMMSKLEPEELNQDQLDQLVNLFFGVNKDDIAEEKCQGEKEELERKEEIEEEELEDDDEELKDSDEELEDSDEELEDSDEELEDGDEELEEVVEKDKIEKENELDTDNDIPTETKAREEYVGYIQVNSQSLEEDTPMDDEESILLAMKHIDDNESIEDNTLLLNTTDDSAPMEEDYVHVDKKEEADITAKYEALNRIKQELNEIQQQREEHVLHVKLNISERAGSPDTLIMATTAENREFLGYEDKIVNILLKLDTIESNGDTNIRNERKSLVKMAENMLQKLDDIKLKEWTKINY